MADIKKFKQAPYFDDFEETKNFLRVLFRPGYSVQTRELNQLQSILQDQIGIISDFALEDRTRVIGGETKLNTDLPYIKLRNSATLSRPLDTYRGHKFTDNDGLEGTIIFVEDANEEDPITLFVKYETASEDRQMVEDGVLVTINDPESEIEESVQVASSEAAGTSVAVSMSEGIFYINKSFIRTEDQFLLINKYSNEIFGDFSIGFIVDEAIVRPEVDMSLLDNATGSPNETAPGAHRFQANVVLVDKASISANDLITYVELLKIVRGRVAAKPRIDNEFTVLEQMLARRTHDQSGDYIVSGFDVDIKEHLKLDDNGGVYTEEEGGDQSKLVAKIDPGIGYIRGYEVRPEGHTYLDVPKARETAREDNLSLQLAYDLSVDVSINSGYPKSGLKLDMKDGSNNIIGNCYIQGVAPGVGQIHVLYIKNVRFLDSTENDWFDVVSLEYTTGQSVLYPFEASVFNHNYGYRNSSLVYKLPYGHAETVLPRSLVFNKEINTVSSGNAVNISVASDETLLGDVTSYQVYVKESDYEDFGVPASVTLTDNRNAVIDISNLTDTEGNHTVIIIAKAITSSPGVRTKTLVTGFTNTIVPSEVLTLSKADVYKVTSIVDVSGTEFVDYFEFDNGCRDSVYNLSTLTLKTGMSLPVTDLTVTFDYFEHGTSGDFFAPSSYANIPYEDIPVYNSSRGDIFMGSAIDFRQRVTSTNVLENIGRNSFVPNDRLVTDVAYYMGRRDRIIVTQRGEIVLVQGTPDINPVLPDEIENSITLYTLDLAPYTFNREDAKYIKLDHRRFTMKDIGRMEKRLRTVEDVALLTSLEREVMDTDFEDRFKSGFVVDSFANSRVVDFKHKDNSIAFDLVENEIRPKTVNTFLDLEIKESSNVVVSDNGMMTLKYTLDPFIKQDLASGTIRIQPFMIHGFEGTLELIPPSDTWIEGADHIDATSTGNGRITSDGKVKAPDFDLSPLAGTWNFSGGVWRRDGKAASREEAAQLDTLYSEYYTGTTIRPESSRTITVASDSEGTPAPFIRERTVEFIGKNLKPGARVYPSFDNVDVSEHVTPTGSVLGSPIIVSGNGGVTGHFHIPKGTFKTGNREFVLSDNPDPRGDYLSTGARFNYQANGTLIQKSVQISRRWSDPVAQSFFIEEDDVPGGCFIDSVDIYLDEIDNNRYPVKVEVREMVNGYPAPTMMSDHAWGVSTENLVGSKDATVATRIKLREPLYLPSKEEYCFVVLTDSEIMSVWTSQLGRRAYVPGDTIQATGEIIAKQPYLGSMFISQNSTTWNAEQERDLKFTLNRCKFTNETGNVTFINKVRDLDLSNSSNIHRRKLPLYPLKFTDGSSEVYVSGWGHGFSVGDRVELECEFPSSTYAGIPNTSIFDTELEVVGIDLFGFSVNVSAPANGSINLGEDIYCNNWIADYSYIQLLWDTLRLPNTGIGFSINSKRKGDLSGPWIESSDIFSDHIHDCGELFAVSKDETFQAKGLLWTWVDNLSPTIRTDRFGALVISNATNGVPLLDNSNDRVEKSSPSRYVQKEVSLMNPANELNVSFDANIQPGVILNVYYKTSPGDIDESVEWRKMDQTDSLRYTNNPQEYFTQRFNTKLDVEFQSFRVMIEIISGDKTRTAKIRDYRVLALNG